MGYTRSHSTELTVSCSVRHGVAWIALCFALAMHVADEALTDFLSVYNPAIITIRERLPWLPLPTFTFEVWLGALIVAVIALSSLTVLVLRGSKLMIALSYVFGASMLLNGLVHIAASVSNRRLMPGVYSAPLLLVASVYLLLTVSTLKRSA